MANYFNISELNSFRWMLKDPVFDARYNTIPPEYVTNIFNPSGIYAAKWQTNDVAQVQLLSDFVPTLKFYNCRTKQLFTTVSFSIVVTALIGVSFKCYQAEVDFSTFPEDFYYGEITYGEIFPDATFQGDVIEPTGPNFVDVNLQLKINAVEVWTLNATGSESPSTQAYGDTYSYEAFVQSAPTADTPKMSLVVWKDDTIIYSESIVGDIGASLLKTGIVQSGSVYRAQAVGCNACVDVPSIDIPDTNPPPVPGTVTWQTSRLDIKAKHAKTLLFEYKNTFNTQNIIFQPTSILLNFRVEGWIALVDPESETEIYTDQEHNETLENAIPYFNETLFVGDAKGVPEWVIKKVNLIFTLDQKKIDGLYYEKAGSDAKFSPTRPENTYNQDAYWALPVIRNEDFFLDGYEVGDNPDENDIQVIVRSKEYLLNGGNITLSDTLKKASRLSYIQITNRELTSYNILVGITPGGNELGVYPLTGNIVDTLAVNKGFNVASTLYVTGLSGHDTDVWIEWHQLDDRTTIPVSGGGGFVKGTVYIYEEINPGDFENDFDIATGLGQTGSKYQGCALSGTNGTIDRSHMLMLGWDRLLPATRDTSIGDPDNSITLIKANLPAVGLNVNGLTINTSYRTGGNTQHAAANDPTAPLATTENMGSGQPIDITPFSLYTTFFVKIVD